VILYLRIAASFALVGLLLWLFARAGAGRLGLLIGGPGRRNGLDPLDVIDRRQLTKSTGVAVIRAGTRHFLVGVSDTGVQMLAEGDDLLSPPDDAADDLDLTGKRSTDIASDIASARTRSARAPVPDPPRMNPFIALREKTVRRS
jgi:flagellar biogenesis protein FliO